MEFKKQEHLPSCPKAALFKVAKFINTIPLTERFPPTSDPRAFTGYVLPLEWIYELLRCGAEAEEIAGQSKSEDS